MLRAVHFAFVITTSDPTIAPLVANVSPSARWILQPERAEVINCQTNGVMLELKISTSWRARCATIPRSTSAAAHRSSSALLMHRPGARWLAVTQTSR